MKHHFLVGLAIAATAPFAAQAQATKGPPPPLAQEAPPPSQGGTALPSQGAAALPGQLDSALDQANGNYPSLEQKTLPIGAIHRTWATRCTPSDTISDVAFEPAEEIKFSTVQLAASTILFEEPVYAMVKGDDRVISLTAYPSNSDGPSRAWVVLTRSPGASTNLQFTNDPLRFDRLYSFFVQTETFNSTNCPTQLVRLRGALPDLPEISPLALTALGQSDSAALTVPALQANNKTDAKTGGNKTDGTGRHSPDYVPGSAYGDPAKLDFTWRAFGEKEMAPDIVYDDGEYMYLQYDEDRLKSMKTGVVSIVNKAGDLEVDSPVNSAWRGNTLIVHGVGKLTIERHDKVVCIVSTRTLHAPTRSDQFEG